MDISLFLILASILFFAGTIQGLAGFGSALVMVPLMVLFMDPKEVVPLAVVQGTMLNFILFLTLGRSAEVRKVASLFIAGVLGLPIGAIVLMAAGSGPLKTAIGLLIIMSSILLLFRGNSRRESGMAATSIVGLVSGALNSSISMSGPPVILFFQREGMGKEAFRANLALYFLALNTATVLLFALGTSGLLTLKIWALSLPLLLPTVLGLIVGIVLSSCFRESHFRTFVLVTAGASGALSLASGMREFLR